MEDEELQTACMSRNIANIWQFEHDGVKAIKYKTARIPILSYILAAINAGVVS